MESVCLNTEELLAEVKMVNDQRTTENIVVGSADVKALPKPGHSLHRRQGV